MGEKGDCGSPGLKGLCGDAGAVELVQQVAEDKKGNLEQEVRIFRATRTKRRAGTNRVCWKRTERRSWLQLQVLLDCQGSEGVQAPKASLDDMEVQEIRGIRVI